jgi:hypothetical protein
MRIMGASRLHCNINNLLGEAPWFCGALEIAKSVSDRSGRATQLANVGFVSSKLYNFEDAVRFHLEALAIPFVGLTTTLNSCYAMK